MQKKSDRFIEELAELLATSHQALEKPDANRQAQFESIVKKHARRNQILHEHDLIDTETSPRFHDRGNHRQHTSIEYVLPSHEQKQMKETGVKKMISDIWVRRPLLVPSWYFMRLAIMVTVCILLGGTLFFGLIQRYEHPAEMEYLHSPEEINIDAFERYINDAWNAGRVGMLHEIFTDDYISHDPLLGENMTGLEATKDLIDRFRAAIPDLQIVIESTSAERDSVRAQLYLTGTQTQPFELADGTLVPASGNPVKLSIATVSRFEGGRIAEMWDQVDTLNLLQQMGVVPQMRQLTTEEQNRVTARFGIEQLWGGQGAIDIEDARKIVVDSFTQTSNCLIGTGTFGPSDVKYYLDMFHRAFPEPHFTVEDILAEGDMVAVHFSFSGVMENYLTIGSTTATMPPTHEEMTWSGIHLARYADGKIVENWWYWDIPGEAGGLLCD